MQLCGTLLFALKMDCFCFKYPVELGLVSVVLPDWAYVPFFQPNVITCSQIGLKMCPIWQHGRLIFTAREQIEQINKMMKL